MPCLDPDPARAHAPALQEEGHDFLCMRLGSPTTATVQLDSNNHFFCQPGSDDQPEANFGSAPQVENVVISTPFPSLEV